MNKKIVLILGNGLFLFIWGYIYTLGIGTEFTLSTIHLIFTSFQIPTVFSISGWIIIGIVSGIIIQDHHEAISILGYLLIIWWLIGSALSIVLGITSFPITFEDKLLIIYQLLPYLLPSIGGLTLSVFTGYLRSRRQQLEPILTEAKPFTPYTCSNCGEHYNSNPLYCYNCGVKLRSDSNE